MGHVFAGASITPRPFLPEALLSEALRRLDPASHQAIGSMTLSPCPSFPLQMDAPNGSPRRIVFPRCIFS